MAKYENAIKKIVPSHRIGNTSGAKATEQEINLNNVKAKYELAKQRLLDVNHWEQYAGTKAVTFQLYSKQGTRISRTAREGDFIAIDIPGPGTRAGKGYDWVIIEKIKEVKVLKENSEVFSMIVRPASSPITPHRDIAHFYTRAATSTFIITREGKKLTAQELGRNLIPNIKTASVIDNVRNAAVSYVAANGFAKPNWKALMKGLIKS